MCLCQSSCGRMQERSGTSEELKTSGSRKLSSAQSSWRLFCSGVPVSSNRFVVLNSLTISESWENKLYSFTFRLEDTRDSQSICIDCGQTCCRWKTDTTANLGFLILDTVSLINDQVSPVELFEDGPLDNNHLIGSHAHIPLAWQQRVTDKSRLQPEVSY